MQTAAGGPIYEEDWSDKLEPYAAGVGLAGDVVGLGAAATGIGIPVGTTIAGFANIPNLIIDGYQTARDAWRSYKDNGASLGSAAWNGGELILDTAGLKFLSSINKAAKAGVASEKYLTSTEKALDSKPWKRVGTGHGRVRARQSANHKRKYNAKRNKALEESNVELAKEELDLYRDFIINKNQLMKWLNEVMVQLLMMLLNPLTELLDKIQELLVELVEEQIFIIYYQNVKVVDL